MNPLTRNVYIVIERHELEDVPFRAFHDRAEAYKYASKVAFGCREFKDACEKMDADCGTPVCIAIQKFNIKGRLDGMEIIRHYGED